MSPSKNHSTFHTDQNKWDRRDFENKEFDRIFNDNEERSSLMGRRADEFDEGLAMGVHEDTYHPPDFGHIHTDEEIEKVVKELLHNSQRIDARDITVTVSNLNVTLSGTVKSQFERDYATSLTKLVHGVGNIKSEIIVKRNEGILPTDIGRKPYS